MSGFGGNGGNNPGFGGSQQSGGQGGPFGSQQTTGGFGGSHGSSAPSFGFGASPQPQPAVPGFSSSPGPSSFGSANMNPFGQQQGPSAPSPPQFGGSSASPAMTTFGASPNVVVSSSTGFGSSHNSTFQQPPPGFHNNNHFGGTPSQSAASTRSAASSAFGGTGMPTNSNSPFGAMQNSNSNPNESSTPFATTSNNTAAAAMTFGSSSNVVTTHNHNNQGGGFASASNNNNNNNNSWGSRAGAATSSSGFGTNTNPFGTHTPSMTASNSNTNDTGMQQQSDNEEMGDGATSPFGPPKFPAAPRDGTYPSRTLSPVKEGASASSDFSFTPQTQTSRAEKDQEERRLKAKMEERRQLQAKIEEKKRKLLERQQRKNLQTKESSSLSAEAAPFMPTSSSSTKLPEPQTLAERNAVRFGEQANHRSTTRSFLPPDVIRTNMADTERGATPDSAVPVTDKDGREDLENAISLAGTCQYMCPDDELIRRESESDIQLLELPLPGTLHPPNWSLRNTAVKRFRRSAADYKLDVPEWVRPADVLERVCGYLEEWVMDRDRQGPDPRFPQGQVPPSLDVYQFIWDRTRMIRKDFTLQNYVGTGGKCDARAVRCHERIARWHAMCEHQLSHIPDFTTKQSQQNIQELGQTMKTLNHFYDDSLNRSLIEVPDETSGRETRFNVGDFTHGCVSDPVQGNDPVDFDGSPLNNAANGPLIHNRIIGSHNVDHPTHGTAEPEMRGLYILLTMNNDGGMEVLKYAAKLFQERPAVYYSTPVQLAWNIFKAKKEYNYARFFAILRAPSTPYLFCCVMFKHVELMRKIAFRIMSKTFGARKRDTGEAIYDAYPLTRLAELLCFEDLEEARTACKHYNVTVKETQVSSSSSPSRSDVAEIIYWRQSDFKEPVHPEKAYIIPLQPRKMTRTIERKLNGATRLAVCRGEVSGEGAALSKPLFLPSPSTVDDSDRPVEAGLSSSGVPRDLADAEERAKASALIMKQKMERARLEKEARIMQEKQRRMKEEQERQSDELRKKQEAEAKKSAELETLRLAEIREVQQKQEQEEALREETMRIQREQEKARKAEEERRLKEAEARRIRLEVEEKRRAEQARKEAEELREREHQERLAEEERKRKAEEARRLEEAKVKRLQLLKREHEARRRKEAEEKRIAKEWRARVDSARKVLLWQRWRRRLFRRLEMIHGLTACLKHIDPTFTKEQLHLGSSLQRAFMENSVALKEMNQTQSFCARRAIESSLRGDPSKICLSSMAVREIESSQGLLRTSREAEDAQHSTKTTLLLKVAVIIPMAHDVDSGSMSDLVRSWINTRLDFGEISVSHGVSEKAVSYEVRSVSVRGASRRSCSDCDVALFVIPPPWSNPFERLGELESLSSLVDDSVPRAVLVLSQNFDARYYESMNDLLATHFGGNMGKLPIAYNSNSSPDAYESALESACRKVAKIFVHEACVKIGRMPMIQLVSTTIIASLWQNICSSQNSDEILIPENSKSALLAVIQKAESQLRQNEEAWSLWPPAEFCSENGVEGYFSDEGNLPVDWMQSLSRENLEDFFSVFVQTLSGSFRDVVQRLLLDAPSVVREECGSLMAKRQFRRCLDKVLRWVTGSSNISQGSFVYLPGGLLESLIGGAVDAGQDDVSTYGIQQEDESLRLEERLGGRKAEVKNAVGVVRKLSHSLNRGEDVKDSTSHSSLLREEIEKGNVESLSTKKRRADSGSRDRDDAFAEGSQHYSTRGKRRREGSSLKLTPELVESAAYSRKLEDLVQGGTVDLLVGDVFLSRLLRTAPNIDLGKR